MPLVEKGREQARKVGEALRRLERQPDTIYCGPLLRHVQTAKIAADVAGVPPGSVIVNEGFSEIDYGRWEGLSNDEIREEFGNYEIDNWQKRSVWPANFGWAPEPGKNNRKLECPDV